MGLDQCAFAIKQAPKRLVDFSEPKGETPEELYRWRKHPNLHGWMEALYFRKGGRNKDFNCAAVVLDSADLDQLERHVAFDLLPVTTGFFFGESDGSEREDDLAFIEKAREAIALGKTVLYAAWW
jgi:hypothetical protein